MFGVNRQTLERLRKEYPSGTKVELIRLDDPYRKIPSGTIGTVEFVDDAGQIHTSWEGNGSLALIYGLMNGEKSMDKIVTVCCGKEEAWESKIVAEQFFL